MKNTYYDKIISRWKNKKPLAWIIFIVICSLGIIKAGEEIVSFVNLVRPKDPTSQITISIRPFDPRFTSLGERMNWGGGSQALFIETRTPEEGQENLVIKDNTLKGIPVWEAMGAYPMRILADVTYNAPNNSPTCIIEQWGIEVENTEIPKTGKFFFYGTGGADAPRQSGQCIISHANKFYPVTIWYDKDEPAPPPSYAQYLKSGEPEFIDIEVYTKYQQTENYPLNGYPAKSALRIRLAAKIRIGNKTATIRSKQYIRAIIPWKFDKTKWNNNKIHWEQMENLRPLAYIEE